MSKKRGIDNPFTELYEKEGLLPTDSQEEKPKKAKKKKAPSSKKASTKALSKASTKSTSTASVAEEQNHVLTEALQTLETSTQASAQQVQRSLEQNHEDLATQLEMQWSELKQSYGEQLNAIQNVQESVEQLFEIQPTTEKAGSFSDVQSILERIEEKLQTLDRGQKTSEEEGIQRIEAQLNALQTQLQEEDPGLEHLFELQQQVEALHVSLVEAQTTEEADTSTGSLHEQLQSIAEDLKTTQEAWSSQTEAEQKEQKALQQQCLKQIQLLQEQLNTSKTQENWTELDSKFEQLHNALQQTQDVSLANVEVETSEAEQAQQEVVSELKKSTQLLTELQSVAQKHTEQLSSLQLQDTGWDPEPLFERLNQLEQQLQSFVESQTDQKTEDTPLLSEDLARTQSNIEEQKLQLDAIQSRLDGLQASIQSWIETHENQPAFESAPIIEKLNQLQHEIQKDAREACITRSDWEALHNDLHDALSTRHDALIQHVDALQTTTRTSTTHESEAPTSSTSFRHDALYAADRAAQSQNIAYTIATVLGILLLCGSTMLLPRSSTKGTMGVLTFGHIALVAVGVFALRWFERARLRIEQRIADHERALKREHNLATSLEPFPAYLRYVFIGVMCFWVCVLYTLGQG